MHKNGSAIKLALNLQFNAAILCASTDEPGLNWLLVTYADLFDTSKLSTIRNNRAHLYFKPKSVFRIN